MKTSPLLGLLAGALLINALGGCCHAKREPQTATIESSTVVAQNEEDMNRRFRDSMLK